MRSRFFVLPLAALTALAACTGEAVQQGVDSVVESTVVESTVVKSTVEPVEPVEPTPAPTEEAPTYAELVAELLPAESDADADADADDVVAVDTSADIELALADFSKRFHPVPGARDFFVDDTFPSEATPALHTLRRNWDGLSAEQRDAITAGLDDLRASATSVYSTADDPAYAEALIQSATALDPDAFAPIVIAEIVEESEETAPTSDTGPDAESEGLVRPAGLRSGPLPSQVPSELTLNRIASEVAGTLQRMLGGPEMRLEVMRAPSDPSKNGFTDTLQDLDFPDGIVRNCTIWMFDNAEISGTAFLISILAHEVFHCWVHTNAAELGQVFRYADYFDEGLATWVGEAFASGSEYGAARTRQYLAPSTYPMFNESYSAHGFWTEIAQLRGNDAQLMLKIPALLAVAPRGAGAIFDVATAGLADEQVATIAARSLNRADFGPNWTLSGSSASATGRPTQQFSLVANSLEAARASRGQQVIAEFAFDELPADEEWIVTHRAAGMTHNRWASGDEFTTVSDAEERFCLRGECECPDGSPLPFAVTPIPGGSQSIHTALMGGTDAASTISMFATSLEDACDEEEEVPQPDGDQPGDLVGTWRASGEVVQQMFQEFYGDSLLLTDVSGDIFLTLGGDGSGSLKYADVTLFFGDVTPPITISGGGTIGWNAGPGELRIVASDFAVSATSVAIGNLPLEMTDEDLPGAGTTTFQVSVDDQVMTLLEPEGTRGWFIVFPRRFIRQ